jgi:hypothetical protein
LLEERLDEAKAEADPAQVPGMAALLLDAVVLHVLVQDVVQRCVLLGRPDEIVHLDGEVGLHFFLWLPWWPINKRIIRTIEGGRLKLNQHGQV